MNKNYLGDPPVMIDTDHRTGGWSISVLVFGAAFCAGFMWGML